MMKNFKQKRLLNSAKNKKYNIFADYCKPAELFKSNVVTPIHTGRDAAFTACKDTSLSVDDYEWLVKNMVGDNTGDNISESSRFYNEASAIYWIWKNCNSKYVGLMHNKRIFDLREFYKSKDSDKALEKYCINQRVLKRLMSQYDIILPKKLMLGESVYSQYAGVHYGEDLELAMGVLVKKYPHLAHIADKALSADSGYFYNMAIMPKKYFDDYAKFLFDILFELKPYFKMRSSRHVYQHRIEAFLSERLSNIYFQYLIEEKKLNFKEVPVVQYEKYIPRSKMFMGKIRTVNDRGKGITLVCRIKF